MNQFSTFPPPAPAPPAAPRRTGLLVAGAAALALVAGGGAFLLAKGDDGAAPAPAPSTTAAVAAPTTPSPTTPSPTTLGPTTVAPTTTASIPADATDLGFGLYLPAHPDISVDSTDPVAISAPGGQQAVLQVEARSPGEDPNDVLQEYIDTFDSDYAAVSYTPTATSDVAEVSGRELRETHTEYYLYDGEDQAPLYGSIVALVRDDGLTLIVDSWATDSATPSAVFPVFDELYDSLVAAPPAGEPGEWYEAVSAYPDTVHETVSLGDCLCRLTLAPGFEVLATDVDRVAVADDVSTIVAFRVTDVVSEEDAQVISGEIVADGATVTDNGDFAPFTGDETPLASGVTGWQGTAADGTALTGTVAYLFDETSHIAYVVALFNGPGEHRSGAIDLIVNSFTYRLTALG